MPRHPSDISGEGLYILCYGHKDVEAIREALRREAMAVDGISYEETSDVVHQLNDANSGWLWLQRLPYQISICALLGYEPSRVWVAAKTSVRGVLVVASVFRWARVSVGLGRGHAAQSAVSCVLVSTFG